MKTVIKLLLFFTIGFNFFSCKTITPQESAYTSNLIIYQIDSSDCRTFSIGEEIILKVKSLKSEQSTTVSFTFGSIENGPEINSMLTRISSCDSVVWLKNIPKKLNLFSEPISFKVDGYSSAPCSIFGTISPYSQYSLDTSKLETIEYGSQIIYDHIQLFANNQFSLLACQDTATFELSGPRWMEQWELQNQPSFISLKSDSIILEEFIIIHEVIPINKKIVREETLDTIQWNEIAGGLYEHNLKTGNGKALRENHWVKINYEVLNAKGEVIHFNDEPLYYYLGSEDVPRSWNYVLSKSTVGSTLFVKASPYWGYGLDGLFPVVPAMEWYYFKIEVLSAE
jgi:hypothetical protein